ncbi:MAG TPA: DNA topoisomerase VI subunit B [Nitrososphaeraceae archaeon]|nr:DNA topoisomerase VI subunit B [Nitrososphaeraceae archaeon]
MEHVERSSPLQTGSRTKINYHRKAESEFFVDNSALAGFTGERILYMAIRELIENSLDSCEAERILPKISISLRLIDPPNELWSISCEDNGIGIHSDKVSVAVCSFLTSGKYVEKQQRGLFGVGLKMIAAFSTKDTDHPLKVWSKSVEENCEYYFELRTDIGTNKPIILTRRDSRPKEAVIKGKSGFRIEAVLRGRLSPVTKNRIYDYISQSSIVNPYAIISFSTDDGTIIFDRRTTIMPEPSKEVLPHPADMDLKTLKKAIASYAHQKITVQGILCNSFQKLSYDKAKEIIKNAAIDVKQADKYSEHELIRIVNICRQTKFQSPNIEHLSPIGQQIFTVGMTSEKAIVTKKNIMGSNGPLNPIITVRDLKPTLTGYSSRACIINNRPTIVECGLAYGGNISYFKLYRFANKIPLLYDEGADVAREVISEVALNKMGISKKQVKEQFSNLDSRSDRAIDLLPIHIFFHICSTRIPYKTAGKESIASEGELKKYMKACLSDLYRKVSKQIRREIYLKDAENRLKLYKYYIPLIVNAISESIRVNANDLTNSFLTLVERHVKKETSVGVSQPSIKNTVISMPKDQNRSIRGRHGSTQRKKSDLASKSNKIRETRQKSDTQEKIENFLTPPEQAD